MIPLAPSPAPLRQQGPRSPGEQDEHYESAGREDEQPGFHYQSYQERAGNENVNAGNIRALRRIEH